MDPSEPIQKDQKIKDLEMDLNDLRQGLVVISDLYKDLKNVSKAQEASMEIDEAIVKPLMEEDLEFEGIWRFHEEILLADPSARVPCITMYETFAEFCTKSGRIVVDQEAFEFVFARMENPHPVNDQGHWIGYRLRTDE